MHTQSLPDDAIEEKIQARYKAGSKQLNNWRSGQLASIQLASLGFSLETSTKSPPAALTETGAPRPSPYWHPDSLFTPIQGKLQRFSEILD